MINYLSVDVFVLGLYNKNGWSILVVCWTISILPPLSAVISQIAKSRWGNDGQPDFGSFCVHSVGEVNNWFAWETRSNFGWDGSQ